MNRHILLGVISIAAFASSVNAAEIVTVEAEAGKIRGAMRVEATYISSPKRGQGTADYIVHAPAAGEYSLELRTRHPSLRVYKIRVSINARGKELKLSSKPNEFSYQAGSKYFLKKGNNVVQLRAIDANAHVDMFRLVPQGAIAGGSSNTPPVVTPPPAPIEPTPGGPEREGLLNHLVGFGQGTSGGKGGPICRVTSLSDSGPGSLRGCVEGVSSAKWVVFDVSGTIRLSSQISVGNNTTIDGRGAQITITGQGLNLAQRQNVIIHNIEITGVADDAIKIYKAKNIWIDHVSLSNAEDGTLDITEQSTGVTISWCKLTSQNKTMLIGANNTRVMDAQMHVTIHHTYFYRTVRRNPLIRFARVHFFNNVLSEWGEGNGGDAIAATMSSLVFVENNVFNPTSANTRGIRLTVSGYIPEPGYVKIAGNWQVTPSDLLENEPQRVFDPHQLYRYEPEVANQALADRVVQGAGRQSVPSW